MAFPARLHALLASEAPVGVVFRRGPANSVCSILWKRDRDEFQIGQWLRARLYERKAAERLLQEAVEAALDVNAHVIAELSSNVPDDSYQGFLRMAELGILDAQVCDSVANPPAQVHLEMLAAEVGDVASPGAVVLDGGRQLGRIQILASAADRA